MNPPSPSLAGPENWNEAYDRLTAFLDTFAVGDHAHVSRVALRLLDEARDLHRENPSLDPTTLLMHQAQKRLAEWLATNLEEGDEAPSRLLATGYVALLLSRVYQKAPGVFLAPSVPDDIRQSLRRTLVATGPDLNVSSMTPRHLDYGPMLDLARQTWHRWDGRSIFNALLFWACIYAVLYLALRHFFS